MVDIATWRSRIGRWSCRSRVLATAVVVDTDLLTLLLNSLCAALLGVLLLIGGVELHPGPGTKQMEVAGSSKDPDLQATEKLTPDLTMDLSSTVLKYTKTSGFATTKGQDYEVALAALLFLRGRKSGLVFQLATNVLGAGAMDDIVFKFQSQQEGAVWTTMFVQLKHKDNSWVNRNMLTNPKGDFSLARYFKSYLEIKQAMTSTGTRDVLFDGDFKDSQFVIFTNAKADDKFVGAQSGNFSQAEKFIWSGSGRVFSLESDEEMLKCLGEQGGEFLSRFRLFCKQPNVKKLQAAVREEIARLGKEKIGDLNIERLCDCYLANVKVWWESRNEILHKGHNIFRGAVSKVRLETCSEQTLKDYKLELDFEDAALSDFKLQLAQLNSPAVHIVSSDSSCKFTLTKLVQSSEVQLFVLPAQQLSVHQQALLAEKKQLIVVAKDWRSEQLDVIVEMLERMRDTFSIVILSDGNNSIDSQLSERFPGGFASCRDDFMMSQVKTEEKEKLIKKEVNFQGHEITLSMLLKNNNENLDQILTVSFVLDILVTESPLTVGSVFPKVIDYYVPRTLFQPCLKSSVLQALEGAVTLQITQREPLVRDLFHNAFDFVNSLTDPPSFHHGDKADIVYRLFQSSLDPEIKDCEVFVGLKFPLGVYECTCVGLRFGQENKVTALRVFTGEKVSKKISILFVSNITIEEDVSKLSAFHNSKHLLCLKDGHLRLVQSNKNIESIRKHIDEDQVSRFAPETAVDVEDRLVLVCAEPGMGKSTLMARLAKNTKAALPHYFVILIALNDHTKLFAEGKHEDALEFLSLAAKMDSPLQRSLLKFALEVSGNVVVILDGFDEIAPRYVQQSCHLLSSLLGKTEARKIWMTSRNSVKQILEKHFSKFSFKIYEINLQEQNNFLKNVWAEKSNLQDSELDSLISKLLQMSSTAIRDKERNFLGIPLQCRMLAEVFEYLVDGSTENAQLPDKLDLQSLVEMFVDKKCKVFVENKLGMKSHSAFYERLCADTRKQFIDSHAKAALLLILGKDAESSETTEDISEDENEEFSERQLKLLGMEKVIEQAGTLCKEIYDGTDKSGFIDEIVNGKPRFIHRVFAEYFVANWISQHLAETVELIKSKMFTPDFTVIRYFFNGILCKGCVLHTAVLQENVNEVKTLLESEDVDVEVQDAGGRTALHLAASLGASWDQEENTRRCEILDIIIDKTRDFKVVDKVLCGSPLRYADNTRWLIAIDKLLCKTDDNGQLRLTLEDVRDKDMLNNIFEQDLDKLLGFCLDNGLPVEHRHVGRYTKSTRRLLLHACFEGSVKVVSLLIGRNANINKIKADFDGPLISASSEGNLEIVKLLVEKHVSTLASPSQCEVLDGETQHPDISKYINMKGEFGLTAIHRATREGHPDVITYLLSQGGDPLSRDEDHETPLHKAARYDNPNALRVLLEALSETQRVDAIHSIDKKRYNMLHWAVMGRSMECLQLLIDAGGKLCQVNCEGETTLMIAAWWGNQKAVKWLLENWNEEREGITLVDFINKKNMYGMTAWDKAWSYPKCRELIKKHSK